MVMEDIGVTAMVVLKVERVEVLISCKWIYDVQWFVENQYQNVLLNLLKTLTKR